MGRLTERDIFSCLAENFRLAAEHAEDLAKLPRKGPTYTKFRDELRLIEGACRQAGHWRQDSRWLKIGLMMAEAHQRAGDWLRGIKMPNGTRIKLAEGHKHPLFMALAEHLRAGQKRAEEFRTKRTNRLGTILPVMLPGPHRDTRPVGWTQSAGGILLPAAQ